MRVDWDGLAWYAEVSQAGRCPAQRLEKEMMVCQVPVKFENVTVGRVITFQGESGNARFEVTDIDFTAGVLLGSTIQVQVSEEDQLFEDIELPSKFGGLIEIGDERYVVTSEIPLTYVNSRGGIFSGHNLRERVCAFVVADSSNEILVRN